MRFRAGLQVPGGGQEQEEEGSSVAALPVLTETARHECGWDLAIWRPLGTLTCTRFWPGWISEGTSAKGDEDEAGASRDTEENFGVGVVPSFPRGEITHTAQHVCMKVTAIQQQRQQSWEQKKRDIKMFLEVRFIAVTCKINSEFSSCSNGGALLVHVQWL